MEALVHGPDHFEHHDEFFCCREDWNEFHECRGKWYKRPKSLRTPPERHAHFYECTGSFTLQLYPAYRSTPWRYTKRPERRYRTALLQRLVAKQGWGRKKHKQKPVIEAKTTGKDYTVRKPTPHVAALVVFTLLWMGCLISPSEAALTTVGELVAYMAMPYDGSARWHSPRLPPSYQLPSNHKPHNHRTTHPTPPRYLESGGGDGVTDVPIHGRPPDAALMTRAWRMMQSIDDLDPSAQFDGRPYGSFMTHSAVSMFLPDGEVITPAADRYEQCPDTQLFFGKHYLTTPAQRQQLKELCMRYKDRVFAYSMNDLSGYTGDMGPFEIKVISNKPVFSRPRKQSQLEKDIANEKCEEMRDAGIIEPAPRSRYASSPTIVAKKAPDGSWTEKRYAIDYRLINLITAPHNTRAPMAEDIFQELGESRFFTKLDMRSGFFQIPLHKDTKPLTGFWWNGAVWQYTRGPFGLRQMPQLYQELMDYELARGGCAAFTRCFIDDILICSDTFEEHLEHIQKVFDTLEAVGLKCHPAKGLFCSSTIEWLGFDVSKHGLTPNEAKVKALMDMPFPVNLDELRCALGKLRYYGCFCENFSSKARPMLDLLKKGVNYAWKPEQQASFDCIRAEISAPGKALQRFDPKKPIFVHCDFSNVGLGAVLSQQDSLGREYMVACCSRSLNKHESNYSSYKGECLAAVWAVKLFRHFLHGRHFTLVTDHEPLKWLMSSSTLEGAHARWASMLQEYDFTIVHRPGSENANADALSRLPLKSSEDRTGARLDHDQTEFQANHAKLQQSQNAATHPIATSGPADKYGVRTTHQLDTKPQMGSVWRAVHEGIVLYEPFGGLCAGLEAVLRNNITVHQYIYSDISSAALQVARYRVHTLQHQYPHLLSQAAIEDSFSTLPMDVCKVTTALLHTAGAANGRQWMVMAGPECKDFSPAGHSKGWSGKHSHTLLACMGIIGSLQQMQRAVPTLFLVENAAMQFNFNSAEIRD